MCPLSLLLTVFFFDYIFFLGLKVSFFTLGCKILFKFLFLLAEYVPLFPIVFDDELGGGIGDAELFRGFIDGVFFVLYHFDESESFLSDGTTTLKVILE